MMVGRVASGTLARSAGFLARAGGVSLLLNPGADLRLIGWLVGLFVAAAGASPHWGEDTRLSSPHTPWLGSSRGRRVHGAAPASRRQDRLAGPGADLDQTGTAGPSTRADRPDRAPAAAPGRPAGQAVPGGRPGRVRQDDPARPVARHRGGRPGGLGVPGRGRQRPHAAVDLDRRGVALHRAGRGRGRAPGAAPPQRGPRADGPAAAAQPPEQDRHAAGPGPGRLPPDHQPDLPPDPDIPPGPSSGERPPAHGDAGRPPAAPGQDAGPRGAGRADRGLGDRAVPGRAVAPGPGGPRRLHRRLPRRPPPRRRLPDRRGAGPPARGDQDVPDPHLDPGAPVRAAVRPRPGDRRVGGAAGRAGAGQPVPGATRRPSPVVSLPPPVRRVAAPGAGRPRARAGAGAAPAGRGLAPAGGQPGRRHPPRHRGRGARRGPGR
jgi:hypothetical protein